MSHTGFPRQGQPAAAAVHKRHRRPAHNRECRNFCAEYGRGYLHTEKISKENSLKKAEALEKNGTENVSVRFLPWKEQKEQTLFSTIGDHITVSVSAQNTHRKNQRTPAHYLCAVLSAQCADHCTDRHPAGKKSRTLFLIPVVCAPWKTLV